MGNIAGTNADGNVFGMTPLRRASRNPGRNRRGLPVSVSDRNNGENGERLKNRERHPRHHTGRSSNGLTQEFETACRIWAEANITELGIFSDVVGALLLQVLTGFFPPLSHGRSPCDSGPPKNAGIIDIRWMGRLLQNGEHNHPSLRTLPGGGHRCGRDSSGYLHHGRASHREPE